MPVTLVEKYNPAWPSHFERIVTFLGSGIRQAALRIEHVGSTAVPGMVAKPVIDLVIVIAPGTFAAVRRQLEDRGYLWEGDKGLPGREAFALQNELTSSLPEHHLYVCEEGASELRKHLAFRDYLRSHPGERERLSALKWYLAETLDNDRQAYIDGKDAIVLEMTDKAFAWLARRSRTT